MRILCAFGQHQYGDPSRGQGTEYAAFIPSLQRLGHEVVHFETWDRTHFPDFRELNQALLRKVQNCKPDILLAVQMHYEIWTETLDLIRTLHDVSTICWTTDDSWKYPQFSRYIGKHYDAMTTTYPQIVPRYKHDGIQHVLLTQWAAAADQLQPPNDAASCQYPVSFVGSAYGNRPRRVEYLRSRGLEVHCFGHGWPSGSVAFERIPEIVRDSTISLNFSSSKGENQIKARTFEVPGWGGFLLTEPSPGLEQYYKPGLEVAVFSDLDDLIRQARHYLETPAERDRIAWAGFERTAREHTYDARLQEVLEVAVAAHQNSRLEVLGSPAPNLDRAVVDHSPDWTLRFLRHSLELPCRMIWGTRRGPRAARRLVFELSWRLMGEKTYTAAGWPGRMFPEL